MAILPTTNTAAPQQQEDESTKRQNRGTGFTNINKILEANKGAGQRIGQAVGGQLAGQAQSVREGIQQSQQQFQQQKQQAGQQAQGAIGAGQGLLRGHGAGVSKDETQEQYAQRLSQSPQPGQQSFSKIGQDLKAAEYQGPMQLANAAKLQSQGATTAALGRLAGTTGGQKQLLSTMVARPGQYTSGQSALDQLLLGQQGQQQIQQGRRATLGLPEQATTAVQTAAEQAQGLKSGIAESREKALQDIQSAITGEGGFQAQATKQAETFKQDATDLAQIMSGKFDTSTPEGKARADQLKAKAPDLLNRLSEFGLDDTTLYAKDDAAVRNALDRLGGSLAQNFGDKKYTDAQRQAAMNLSDVLGASDLKERIEQSKFNTDVFGKEADAFSGLNAARTYDTETKNILTGAADQLKGMKQNLVTQAQNQLQQRIAEINAGPDVVNVPQFSGPDVQKTKQQLIDEETNKTNVGIQSIMNQSHNNPGIFNGGSMWNGDAVRYEFDRGLGDQLSPYGFLAYGDRGEADVDQRFRNLGLTTDIGAQSGTYRNEQQFRNAAQKALGPDAQMRDYILNKILGINTSGLEGGTDINTGGGQNVNMQP